MNYNDSNCEYYKQIVIHTLECASIVTYIKLFLFYIILNVVENVGAMTRTYDFIDQHFIHTCH